MKVFDGQRTVWPRTPAHSSAASAAPVHPLNATASTPFHVRQTDSKRRVISPSDQRSESRTSSHSEYRRSLSRRSKPIAKRERVAAVSGRDVSVIVVGGAR